ncbi:MAG: ureidoglycolate lyase [Clostridiales Family XIII bacterium]|jgi:ureidoglycolate hydrolase|nr:ureidoglycolate lyase [Clostridiales Family XIII bacterium]
MKPIELSADAFREYGQLIHDLSDEKLTTDFSHVKYWKKITEFSLPSVVSTSYLIGRKRNFVVTEMERHFNTNEVIIPLDNDAILVVAKPDAKTESPVDVTAFYLRRSQGVVLHQNIWHVVPFPINADESAYFILFAKGTEENDLHFHVMGKIYRIEV